MTNVYKLTRFSYRRIMDLPPRHLTVALTLIQILKPLLTLTLYTTFLPLLYKQYATRSPKYTQQMTHTHPFNGPFSGTTRVSRYQKGKTNLDFTEARDSEWQWYQLGHMQVCTSLQTQITTPAPHRSVFYRPVALPAAQPTASKH